MYDGLGRKGRGEEEIPVGREGEGGGGIVVSREGVYLFAFAKVVHLQANSRK